MASVHFFGEDQTVSGEFYVDEWEKDGTKHQRPCLRVNQIQPTKKLDNSTQQPTQPQQQSSVPDDMDDSIPF